MVLLTIHIVSRRLMTQHSLAHKTVSQLSSVVPSCTHYALIVCCLSFLRDAITNYHQLGGANQQKFIFSLFWRLDV